MDYVAAEMRALGADSDAGKGLGAALGAGYRDGGITVSWPGQAPGTTQKMVLTALGGSVATPPEGLTAEVVVVDDWQQLHALPADAVKGKILLFNHTLIRNWRRPGMVSEAYGNGVVYRGGGADCGGGAGSGCGAGKVRGRSGFQACRTRGRRNMRRERRRFRRQR